MKNDISLGTFAAGQTKNLNVQLQIDSEIGNEYQGLLGLVRWVWSAQGDETTETPLPPPMQTGDNSNIALFGFVAMVSAASLILMLVFGRKKRRELAD